MQAESLHTARVAGVELIVAIDSTRRGPALGGCRWRCYPDAAAARRDALDLARAMTRKAALAGLDLGGGKAVVIGDPRARTREQLLAFGDFVESLEGRYITAADMGTGQAEMAVIAQRTAHVIGLPRELGGCGDPAPFTALGVELAMVAALAQVELELAGAHVAVQGAGSVGSELVRLLLGAGARVSVADPDPLALSELPPEAEIVATDAITRLTCEVFAPCGPPAVIDRELARALRCRIICGAANNPLSTTEAAVELSARGILYVPDFLANAGGLIHLACARAGGDATLTRQRLSVIPENLGRVLERARSDGTNPAEAAEAIASAAVAFADHG